MSTLYILQLEHGKWYVGKTDDINRRYSEHKAGNGSEWTKIHKPIKIFQTKELKSEEDENTLTKELMKKHGIENVRGGSFVQRNIPDYVKKTIELEKRGNTDACFKCGEHGHFAKDCDHEEDEESDDEIIICGDCNKEFDSDKEFNSHYCKPNPKYSGGTSQYGKHCSRCGRTGHLVEDCYAYTTIDGEYLGKPSYELDYYTSDSE